MEVTPGTKGEKTETIQGGNILARQKVWNPKRQKRSTERMRRERRRISAGEL